MPPMLCSPRSSPRRRPRSGSITICRPSTTSSILLNSTIELRFDLSLQGRDQPIPTYSTADKTYPREPWFARREAKAYGIALDAQGKIAWGRSEIGGDPVVAVLTEQVSDAHLAGLRQDGVSYIFEIGR